MDDNLPKDARPLPTVYNKVIVYEETHPENGPWRDRLIQRTINDTIVDVLQSASTYGWYPYRFGIRRATDWVDDKRVQL